MSTVSYPPIEVRSEGEAYLAVVLAFYMDQHVHAELTKGLRQRGMLG